MTDAEIKGLMERSKRDSEILVGSDVRVLGGEVLAWRERFRALVGEDTPDAAGNVVITLLREAP